MVVKSKPKKEKTPLVRGPVLESFFILVWIILVVWARDNLKLSPYILWAQYALIPILVIRNLWHFRMLRKEKLLEPSSKGDIKPKAKGTTKDMPKKLGSPKKAIDPQSPALSSKPRTEFLDDIVQDIVKEKSATKATPTKAAPPPKPTSKFPKRTPVKKK